MLAGRAHRPRGHRRHRRLQGGRGLPPPGRRRRPRRPGDDRGRRALRRRAPRSRRWPPSRCRPRCGTTTTRSRTPGSARRPTSSSSRPATARLLGAYAAGICRRPAHHTLLATRAPGRRLPGDAHRDVGAPGGAGQPAPRCAAAACTSSSPTTGRLAGGDVGAGRLADAGDDRRRRRAGARRRRDLAGLHVLVTAGGTREPIDAVRVIANRSSGKQGYALAAEAARRGAPRSRSSPPSTGRRPPGVEVVRGRDRGRDGGRPCWPRRADADVVVMAAAVADFRPEVAGRPARSRRTTASPEIVLEPTPDILAGLGARKRPGSDARRLRGRDRRPAWPTPAASCAASTSTSSSPTTSSAPGVGFEHDTNAVTHPRRRRRRAECRADRQAGGRRRGPRRRRRWRSVDRSTGPAQPTGAAREPLDLHLGVGHRGPSRQDGRPVSDAVLDAILAEDPNGRVACETLLTTGLCVVAGEITTDGLRRHPQARPRDDQRHRLRHASRSASTATPAA